VTDYEKPTAQSEADAKPRLGAPVAPIDLPPLQLGDDFLEKHASNPGAIDAALRGLQLHVVMGGALDDEGWPLSPAGKRMTPPASGSGS
jgi:hypothetical protein